MKTKYHASQIAKRTLNKSTLLKKDATHFAPDEHLAFVTKGTPRGIPLRDKPVPDEGTEVWSGWPADERAPSTVLSGRLKWELRIFFALENYHREPLSVFDIHSHVYFASGQTMPLAMVIHRACVELSQDNSILTSDMEFNLSPGETQPVKLVFETSLYDTQMTTIVFGLFADYRRAGHPSPQRVQSDNIYVFQHWHEWGTEKCHFVARNDRNIAERMAAASSDEEAQKFCRLLQECFSEHKAMAHKATAGSSKPGETEPKRPFGLHISERRKTFDAQNFANLEQQSPAAAQLLRVLSFFSATSFPERLLFEAFYQLTLQKYVRLRVNFESEDYWGLSGLQNGARARNDTISVLLSKGALCLGSDNLFSVPESGRKTALEQMTKEDQVFWVKYALSALEAICPDERFLSPDQAGSLVPHAKSCLDHLTRLKLHLLESVGVSMPVAEYLHNIGRNAEAEPFAEHSVQTMNNLEKKHPGLIAAVTITLAEILRLQRKFSRIEELLTSARELLHQSGEESGEDHAICIHNLGAYYRDTKKYDEAERCYNEALEILKRESPPNFRLLASAFDSQATLFLETNRPSEAQAARAMAEHARRHQESLSG